MTPQSNNALNEPDPVTMVERLTKIALRLDEVLVSETDVLKNAKPGKVVEFHEEKVRLANEFALQVNAIKKAPHLIDRAPAERVKALKAAMTALNDRSEQSGKLLSAAKSVSDGFIRTVASFAAKKRAPQTGYGQSGAMAVSTRHSTPLSLDASF